FSHQGLDTHQPGPAGIPSMLFKTPHASPVCAQSCHSPATPTTHTHTHTHTQVSSSHTPHSPSSSGTHSTHTHHTHTHTHTHTHKQRESQGAFFFSALCLWGAI